MGRKSSMSSDPSQNPKKSHNKSRTSNVESFESDMDLKAEDSKESPVPDSSPSTPVSPKPITANPSSSKFATSAKKAGNVDEDSIWILKKVIEFMSNNGGKTPTESTINPLFDSVNHFLTRKVSSCNRLYNKIRNLKRRYFKLIENEIDTNSPELSTFVDLCAKIWGQANGKAVKGNIVNGNGNAVNGNIVNGNGSKGKRMKSVEDEISEEIKTKKLKAEESDDEDDDNSDENNNDDESGFEVDGAKNSDMFPIMFEQTKRLWQEEGFLMDDLENAFELIDKSLCKKFAKRWKELVARDLELEINKLKTDIELRNMVFKMIH